MKLISLSSFLACLLISTRVHAFSFESLGEDAGVLIAIAVVISFIIALSICLKYRAEMLTARKATEANHYLCEDSISIAARYDTYTHTTTQRTPRRKK